MKTQIKKNKVAVFDILFYYSGYRTDRGSRSALQLNGELDIDILIKAFNKSIDLVPVLKSKWVVERFYYHWEVIPDFDIKNYMTVTYDSDEAENFLLETINCETSPQIKVMIYRNKGKDTLQILFTHLCFDGSAIKNFHDLISKYYTGLKRDENFVIKENLDLNRNLWSLFKNFTFKQRLKFAFRSVKRSRFDYKKWAYLESDSAERKNVLLKNNIGEDILLKLLEKTKKNGVKINDVFLASLAKVYFTISKENDSPLEFNCAFDLRSYIKGKRKLDFTNKVSRVKIIIDRIEGESFEELISRVSKQMKDNKDNYFSMSGVEMFRLLPFLLRIPALKERISKIYLGSNTLNISNLGVIPNDIFKFDEITAKDFFVAGSIRHRPPAGMSINTFNNIITIASVFKGTEKEIEHNKKNAEMFISNIEKYVE